TPTTDNQTSSHPNTSTHSNDHAATTSTGEHETQDQPFLPYRLLVTGSRVARSYPAGAGAGAGAVRYESRVLCEIADAAAMVPR
ncbi:hypothetical protein, partial [Hamadaea tsunoensis]|uniref:hypothetical protein n=1 Tax=Hamadaea tsunoensis TaxID=53368 RepID=UPI001B7FAEDC